jgi:hypothetical protein
VPSVPTYLEVGKKRVFAGAVDWPGWSRSGRDEASALEALVEYGPRYRLAVGRAGRGFTAPKDVSALDVIERLKGDGSTDFGAPGKIPASDQQPLDEGEADRWIGLLEASWAAFDRSAEAAIGVQLRKGPRGGGRERDIMVVHVYQADGAYLPRLAGTYRPPADAGIEVLLAGVRQATLEALGARIRGEPIPTTSRVRTFWPPRYFIRRSAWHALDHGWEIEDRAMTG